MSYGYERGVHRREKGLPLFEQTSIQSKFGGEQAEGPELKDRAVIKVKKRGR